MPKLKDLEMIFCGIEAPGASFAEFLEVTAPLVVPVRCLKIIYLHDGNALRLRQRSPTRYVFSRATPGPGWGREPRCPVVTPDPLERLLLRKFAVAEGGKTRKKQTQRYYYKEHKLPKKKPGIVVEEFVGRWPAEVLENGRLPLRVTTRIMWT